MKKMKKFLRLLGEKWEKIKDYLRLLKERWKEIDKSSRYLGLMGIIIFIIALQTAPNPTSFLKQENYTAMEQVITNIVEDKNTDVKFDTSKIDNYEVEYKENGNKEICLEGKGLEVIYVTLDENYQIKELTRGGIINVIFVCILYFMLVYGIGNGITVFLFFINRTIKKIYHFLKN